MDSMMGSIRGIARTPMGIFDKYRGLCFKYKKGMNIYMMFMGIFFIGYFGKGAEKMNMYGDNTSYELK